MAKSTDKTDSKTDVAPSSQSSATVVTTPLPPADSTLKTFEGDGVEKTPIAVPVTTGADGTQQGSGTLTSPTAPTQPAPPSTPAPPEPPPTPPPPPSEPAVDDGAIRARVWAHGSLKLNGKLYGPGEIVMVPRDLIQDLVDKKRVGDPNKPA